MVFHFGISARQYLKMSAISRSEGLGGKMYVPRAMYSFSTSFWIVPVSWSPVTPCSSADELVQQQQQRGGGVDRHRRGDLVQRDAVEQHPHVVDRVDGDAHLADLAVRDRGVGVVAHLGGQVEGDGQARRAVGDELPVAGVGLGGRAEAGVLAHRPGAAGVHRRIDAPREGVRARLAQLLGRVPAVQRLRAVDRLDGQSGLRLARHGRVPPAGALLAGPDRRDGL